MTPPMDAEARARELMTELNKEYGSEVFVGDGYGYFDDAVAAIATALREERARAIEEAAKIVELCPYGILSIGRNDSFVMWDRESLLLICRDIRALKDKP